MMLSLFGDAVVAVLLVVTISYAVMLNQRLGVLRGDRAKLEALVNGLTVAAQRAESGIAALKEASEDSGRRLEKTIVEGQKLRDDLTYMLERGSLIADRLEGTIRARRDDVRAEPAERKREPKLETPPRAVAPEGDDAARHRAVARRARAAAGARRPLAHEFPPAPPAERHPRGLRAAGGEARRSVVERQRRDRRRARPEHPERANSAARAPGSRRDAAGARAAAAAAPDKTADKARQDPLQMSPQEIDELQQLSQRRLELDKRAAELSEREVLMQAAEKRIDEKIAKLQTLQSSIEGAVKQQSADDQARVQSLAHMYEQMKPQDAARVFDQLDVPVVLTMMSLMRELKAAPILAAMDPAKAKAVTIALTDAKNASAAPPPQQAQAPAAAPAPQE